VLSHQHARNSQGQLVKRCFCNVCYTVCGSLLLSQLVYVYAYGPHLLIHGKMEWHKVSSFQLDHVLQIASTSQVPKSRGEQQPDVRIWKLMPGDPDIDLY